MTADRRQVSPPLICKLNGGVRVLEGDLGEDLTHTRLDLARAVPDDIDRGLEDQRVVDHSAAVPVELLKSWPGSAERPVHPAATWIAQDRVAFRVRHRPNLSTPYTAANLAPGEFTCAGSFVPS